MPSCITSTTIRWIVRHRIHSRFYRFRQLHCNHTLHSQINQDATFKDPGDTNVGSRQRKRRQSSPSKALEYALEATNRSFALPDPPPHKMNLSYMNIQTADSKRWAAEQARERLQIGRRTYSPRLSLQTILADYILHDAHQLHWHSFDKEAITFLDHRGYQKDDIQQWHSILTTEDSKVAAEKMLYYNTTTKKHLPTFVFLFFMRRHSVTPDALRCVLIYAWQQAYRLESSPMDIDSSSLFIAVVRLFRWTRLLWPDAFITVTRLFARIYDLQRPPDNNEKTKSGIERRTARNTSLYNSVLSMLSLPTSLAPFRFISVQQRAQFDLLQKMADASPSLPITREGYGAIIRVQLASKKTQQEREWADLKSTNWPPWKQDKTGMDADKDSEYGISRALKAIRLARQAGYASREWEKVAEIMAGWDTDGSPTIQTRAFLLHKAVSRPSPTKSANHEALEANENARWAARIKTTRTVQEAWAAFLTWQDSHLPNYQAIHLAILEKLHQESVRARQEETGRKRPGIAAQPVTYGDSKELIETPVSPKEGVYVRSPPPSMDEFAEHMRQKGFPPKDRALYFLISHASTLDHGLKYTVWACQLDGSLACLLNNKPEHDSRIHQIPLRMFHAYIVLLCRFPNTRTLRSSHKLDFHFDGQHPFLFAYRLMKARSPTYRPSWHAILAVLADRKFPIHSIRANIARHVDLQSQEFDRWSISQDLRRTMKSLGLAIDFETFLTLCRSLEKAIFAAIEITKGTTNSQANEYSSALQLAAKTLLGKTSFRYSRTLFYDLVGTQDARIFGSSTLAAKQKAGKARTRSSPPKLVRLRHVPLIPTPPVPSLPSLLASPQPQTLHAYVRILGLLRQWSGLLEFVRWLVHHETMISAAAAESRNGQLMLRRTLISIRVFAERSWRPHGELTMPFPEQNSAAAPTTTRNTIKKLLVGVEAWGGWPGDKEVEAYCFGEAAGRFPP